MLVKNLIRKLEACDPESIVKLWDRINKKHIGIKHVVVDEESVDLVFYSLKE